MGNVFVRIFGLAIFMLAWVIFLSATPAHADVNGVPPVIGGTTNGNPIPNPPGDGSTGNPTPPPDGSVWLTGSIELTPTHFNGHHYEDLGGRLVTIAYYCAPKGKGHDWIAVSAWWQIGVNPDTGAATTVPNVGCTWPQEPTDQNVTCAAVARVTITRERSADGVVSERLKRVTDTSAWSSDRDNLAKCNASAVEVQTDTRLKLLGGYAVDTLTTLVPCVARTTYDGRAPRIVDCGTGRDRAERAIYGLYCNGKKVRLDENPATAYDHTWDWANCTGTDGLVRCNYTGVAPTFDGRIQRAQPFSILDDATARTVAFPALSVDGIVGAPTNVRTRLVTGKDISPTRGGNPNASDQPFVSDKPLDKWIADDASTWVLAWMAPGVHGKPWTATKESAFTAQVKVTTWTVTQVDIFGRVTLTKGTSTMDVSTSCGSEEFSVDVSRAKSVSVPTTR